MEAFQTQNLALAITLATCGVPFFEADGKSAPVINFYDRDILLEMTDGQGRQIYKGWNIEAAAGHAWKAGREGKVVYCFQSTPELAAICEAFNEQAQAIKDAQAGRTGAGMGIPTAHVQADPSELARFACQLLTNRKILRDLWQVPVPVVAIHSAQKHETQGRLKISTGSFKVISLNASPETRKRLGL